MGNKLNNQCIHCYRVFQSILPTAYVFRRISYQAWIQTVRYDTIISEKSGHFESEIIKLNLPNLASHFH